LTESLFVQRFRLAGEYEEALRASERILHRNPRNRWAWLERAEVLIAMKEYEKAAAELDRLIEMFPDFPQARSARERLPVPPYGVKPAPSPRRESADGRTLTALFLVAAGTLIAALAALLFRRSRARRR
jgi:tetratricopeptide (TPR) repeat protein